MNRKLFFALAGLSVLVLFFLLPASGKNPLNRIARALSHPVTTLQEKFTGMAGGIGRIWSGYIALRGVQEENLRLREELVRLQSEQIQHREAQAALKRLEPLLALKQQVPYRVIAARVVARDASNWYRTLLVDKGEKDGVAVDVGVIIPDGVVGRVVKTTPEYSTVLLLTDRYSAVAALVQRTRDEGIVEGTEKGLARVKYLPALSELAEGDEVLTSGLAGTFPKGLLIGRIRRVEKQERALFQEAEVMPAVDFSGLEEVLVIVSKVGAETGSGVPPGEGLR
jgi:rod shape-determining protein MreC